MRNWLTALLILAFMNSALAEFTAVTPSVLKAKAYAKMKQCLGKLAPKERELPPTCTWKECSILVRSCWQEGIQVVQEQISAIEQHAESTHFKDDCARAFDQYNDFATVYGQEYLQLQQQLAFKGAEYEWFLPPKLRGDAGILNELVHYEIVLKLFKTECR